MAGPLRIRRTLAEGTNQSACRLGVLALGDSITHGGGELQWGVALQSWALWTARALGLPYSGYAFDGARARDVVEVQIPRHERLCAHPEGRYEVGCLYIGVNDVRSVNWDLGAFAADQERALAWLRARCDRVLCVTAPRRLGVPPAGASKVGQLNSAVRAAARRHGALVVELEDFRARNHVMADRVHPTALGQVAIAERALAVLAADGLVAPVSPAALISYSVGRRARLRSDWTYVYRSAKAWGRAAAVLIGSR